MAQHKYDDLFATYEATLYADADQAVTKAGLWDWMREFTPRRDQGFLFTSHPNIDVISSHMKLADQHSGASFAITMRAMEYIAKNGWDKWVAEVKLRRNSGH
jgi:hypothetical protein